MVGWFGSGELGGFSIRILACCSRGGGIGQRHFEPNP